MILFSRNWPLMVLLALLAYFVTHAFMGAGSVQALRALGHQELILLSEADHVHRARTALQERVDMLRSDALDPDFLEESVRHELGYVYDDEIVIFLDSEPPSN